jgi:methylmalonyl-CoA mutase N-terminal domain/subunit
MVALRTQQVIAEESGVANTVDPLGGSFFVEQLTNEMEEKAMEYIRRIDEMGGMVAAIKRGYPQREIADAAFHYQRLVDAGEKRIVGVNAYQIDEEQPIPLLRIDDSVEKRQVTRTRQVRRKRNARKAQSCIDALKDASLATDVNLMPLLVDAAREYVTLGEMCDALRETMGVYTDPAMF